MDDAEITSFIMHDGSRRFLSLPESILSGALFDRIGAMPNTRVTEFIETIPESWIDFEFHGFEFSINTQFGEYWFFVRDRNCPDDILIDIRDRFATILSPH